MSESKTCPSCERTKPLTAVCWYRNAARGDGFDSHCRQCKSEHARRQWPLRRNAILGRRRDKARSERRPCIDCDGLRDSRSSRCHPCSLRHQAATTHPNWAGGRTKSAQGYWRVMAKGHPKADRIGYVAEHRLVMERMIGRHLLPNENVHHKNGDKGDNAPENLELWVKSQPCGQRVADKIAHAKQILETYEPSALAPLVRSATG